MSDHWTSSCKRSSAHARRESVASDASSLVSLENDYELVFFSKSEVVYAYLSSSSIHPSTIPFTA